MKWDNEKIVNFDDLENSLRRTESLMDILAEYYFFHSKEAVTEKPYLLTFEYDRFFDLAFVIRSGLCETMETLEIVRKNHESESR